MVKVGDPTIKMDLVPSSFIPPQKKRPGSAQIALYAPCTCQLTLPFANGKGGEIKGKRCF